MTREQAIEGLTYSRSVGDLMGIQLWFTILLSLNTMENEEVKVI